MSIKKSLLVAILLCLTVGPLLACSSLPLLSDSNTPSSTSTGSTANGQSTPALNVWNKVASGVEIRYEGWKKDGNEDTVIIVRLNMHNFRLSIGYQPSQPLSMSDWMKQEQAVAIINGGYFDQNDRATGLVIADGQSYGASYNGFGGMLSVDAQGNVGLRSLRQQPYDPTEGLQQATQSSPMLLLPGGQPTQFNANAVGARRSIVAMDKQGNMLLIASPGNAFTLQEMQDLLVSSDLSLDVALNMDGGASTGLYVNAGSSQVAIDSFTNLPLVIIVKSVTG